MQLDTIEVWKAFWRVFLIAASIIGLFWVGIANAATQCGPYGFVSKNLINKFGESPRASGTTIGRDATLRIMQAWVSKDGSWTILVTGPTGTSCIVIVGQDWEDVLFEPGQKS